MALPEPLGEASSNDLLTASGESQARGVEDYCRRCESDCPADDLNGELECPDCVSEKQEAHWRHLLHLAAFDRWQGMTDAQRDADIRWAAR